MPNFIFILVYFILPQIKSFNLTDANETYICPKYIPKTQIISYTDVETFNENIRTWCFKYPFRCTKTKVSSKNVTKQRTVSVIETIKRCCSGYEFDETQTTCLPSCSKTCENGKCVKPEVCECNEGYIGNNCEICLKCGSECPEGFFGPNCKNECQCNQDNGRCDSKTGVCKCAEGWRDEDCNTPCPKYYFGKNCSERCDRNQSICDHVTGLNFCRDGFTGSFCDKKCPYSTFSKNCTKTCNCRNDAVCDNQNGTCYCKTGWTGKSCETPCDKGFYGINCDQNCLCSNQSICSPIDGQCKCYPGWKGIYCTEQCNYGYYGDHCATPCNCESENFICDNIEGCKCPDNFTGVLCDVNLNDKYEPYTNEQIYINDNSGLYAVIGILSTIIILIILGFAIFYYYRNRYNKIQEERYNVQYTANSFANIAETTPLNNSQIVNDLGFQFSKNTTDFKKKEERCANSDSTQRYDVPKSKNLEADLTNPNFNQTRQNLDEKRPIPQMRTNLDPSRPTLNSDQRRPEFDETRQNFSKSEENLARYVNMNRISEEPENIYESIDSELNKL